MSPRRKPPLARQFGLLEGPPRDERKGRTRRALEGALRAPVGMVIPSTVSDYGYTVATRCTAPARAWLCLSCSQYLANDWQREAHTEKGAHMLARVCPTHGAESPRKGEL